MVSVGLGVGSWFDDCSGLMVGLLLCTSGTLGWREDSWWDTTFRVGGGGCVEVEDNVISFGRGIGLEVLWVQSIIL